MQFVKALTRGLASHLFKLFLAIFLVSLPLVLVFGSSKQLKTSLRDSKIYDAGVDQIIENAGKKDAEDDNSSFKQTGLIQAARTAVTPSFLQSTTEQIIDGMYGWLDGKTTQPEFRIDIAGVKQRFIQAVGDYAVNRAQKLPVCSPTEARQLLSSKIDPLTITCMPAGYDVNQLRSLVSDQINKNNKGIFQQSVLTPDTLPKKDDGQTAVQAVTKKAQQAPRIFQLLKQIPLISGIVVLVCGAGALLLYDDKRRGWRNLAITTLGLGIVAVIGCVVTIMVLDKLAGPSGLGKNIDAKLQQPVLSLARSLVSALNTKLLILGIIHTVIGIGVLLALHFTKPHKEVPDPKDALDTPHIPEDPSSRIDSSATKPTDSVPPSSP